MFVKTVAAHILYIRRRICDFRQNKFTKGRHDKGNKEFSNYRIQNVVQWELLCAMYCSNPIHIACSGKASRLLLYGNLGDTLPSVSVNMQIWLDVSFVEPISPITKKLHGIRLVVSSLMCDLSRSITATKWQPTAWSSHHKRKFDKSKCAVGRAGIGE